MVVMESVVRVARPERRLRAVPSSIEPDAASRAFDVAAEYDAHGPALFGFAVVALRDRGAAEDCVQETFLRAWRARDRFDPARASVRTWLFAILRNVITDAQRASARRPVVSDELEDAPAESPDPLVGLGVAEALGRLSDDHREAVVAVHIAGESYAEASARLGVPVATLRTRAFYALRALRGHLNGKENRHD